MALWAGETCLLWECATCACTVRLIRLSHDVGGFVVCIGVPCVSLFVSLCLDSGVCGYQPYLDLCSAGLFLHQTKRLQHYLREYCGISVALRTSVLHGLSQITVSAHTNLSCNKEENLCKLKLWSLMDVLPWKSTQQFLNASVIHWPHVHVQSLRRCKVVSLNLHNPHIPWPWPLTLSRVEIINVYQACINVVGSYFPSLRIGYT